MAGGLGVTYCNPYGHGTDAGPKHVLGGMFPASHEGNHKWYCPNPADGRFIMRCDRQHQGNPFDLCYPHVRMIQRRQSGLCTRCAYPPEAIALEMDIRSCQATLRELLDAGLWHSPHGSETRRKIMAYTYRMDELFQSGRIRHQSLRLIEVS